MLIFLFFALLYGLANLHIFFSLTFLLALGTVTDIMIGLAVLLLALSPVLVHLYSFHGRVKTLRVFSYISYMWISFLMIFFPTALLIDLYNYIVSNAVFGTLEITPTSSLRAFLIPLSVSIAVNTFGLLEARCLKVERLMLKSSKIPEGVEKITVVHISDLHLGIVVGDQILKNVIKVVKETNPDLIVSTGDLVDGIVQHINHYAEKLKNVSAQIGKFAVLGNHEIYGGLKHAIRFIENAGFTLLRNRSVTIDNLINIAGVDDPLGKRQNEEFGKDREVLDEKNDALYTIFLKHRAKIEKECLGFFDLQLSGHTHKGQIFPVSLATMFMFEHHSGFKKLSKGSAIYVSRGAGTVGPPVRFLSRPEIAIIEIVRQ